MQHQNGGLREQEALGRAGFPNACSGTTPAHSVVIAGHFRWGKGRVGARDAGVFPLYLLVLGGRLIVRVWVRKIHMCVCVSAKLRIIVVTHH